MMHAPSRPRGASGRAPASRTLLAALVAMIVAAGAVTAADSAARAEAGGAKAAVLDFLGDHLDELAGCIAAGGDPEVCVDAALQGDPVGGGTSGIGFAIASWLKFKLHDNSKVDYLICRFEGGSPEECHSECKSCGGLERASPSSWRSVPAIASLVAAYAIAIVDCQAVEVVCARPAFWPASLPWNIAT